MKHHNILIVDDDDLVLKVLKRQLVGAGYDVISAESGGEGLMKLACFDVSLVISDHVMPDMTGLEFLQIVRNRYPAIVRIMLTGHADLDTAIACINGGEIFRFLVKPWEYNVLLSTVKLSLEKVEREKEQKKIVGIAKRKDGCAKKLERRFPGITEVTRDSRGVVFLG